MTKHIDDKLTYQASVLADLNSIWQPHDGQIDIGRALFYDNTQYVFLECGRKFGKSEFILYFLYRWCLSYPNQATYYIAPFQDQARELIWENGRITDFLPTEMKTKYIAPRGINNQKMRIRFKNGSFLRLDGADNHQKYRGINPHAIAYDEFKDHHPKFHEGMDPNLATHQAPMLIVGTPPDVEDHYYCKIADECKREDGMVWFNRDSYQNPYISAAWLDKKKRQLVARGEESVWLNEYMAQRTSSGHMHIYPMYSDARHKISYEKMQELVYEDNNSWDFFVTCDPGTATCFAVLFTLVHRFDKRIYHVNNLYETDQLSTSTGKMWLKINKMAQEIVNDFRLPITPHNWWDQDGVTLTYDEAALWFANESIDRFGVFWSPTAKSQNKKEVGISLIKDQMLYDYFRVSDRCVIEAGDGDYVTEMGGLTWEIKKYKKDEKGRIPKVDDHLMDTLRYANAAAYYVMVPRQEPPPRHSSKRFATIESDMDDMRIETDWASQFDL